MFTEKVEHDLNEIENDLQDYTNYLERSGYAKRTIKLYLMFWNLLSKGEATQEGIDKFIHQHNHELARAFLKSYLFDFFKVKDLEIPKIKGRRRTKIPLYVSHKEYKQLIEDSELRFSVKLLIRLLYESGLRISEATSITPKMINFERSEIRGIGKGNKEYVVNYKPKTGQMLKYLIKSNSIGNEFKLFSFGSHRAWELIKKDGERILSRHLTPHQFRHGCATHLLKMGWNLKEVQEYMRHENLDTVDIYTHITRTDIDKKLKKMGYFKHEDLQPISDSDGFEY